MTYRAHDGSSSGWLSSGLSYADEFKRLGGDLGGMSVGASYGDGLYQVVTMNADQPGWGSAVPAGYEKVAYIDTDASRDDTTPGKALLRKVQGQAPAPSASPAAPSAAAPDLERIKAATERAAAYKAGYEKGSNPSLAAAGAPAAAPSNSGQGTSSLLASLTEQGRQLSQRPAGQGKKAAYWRDYLSG